MYGFIFLSTVRQALTLNSEWKFICWNYKSSNLNNTQLPSLFLVVDLAILKHVFTLFNGSCHIYENFKTHFKGYTPRCFSSFHHLIFNTYYLVGSCTSIDNKLYTTPRWSWKLYFVFPLNQIDVEKLTIIISRPTCISNVIREI